MTDTTYLFCNDCVQSIWLRVKGRNNGGEDVFLQNSESNINDFRASHERHDLTETSTMSSATIIAAEIFGYSLTLEARILAALVNRLGGKVEIDIAELAVAEGVALDNSENGVLITSN